MKPLLYTIRYLRRGKSRHFIKCISLTLGLMAGLVLFTQTAFELSFDRFYPDADRIYQIHRKLKIGDQPSYEGSAVNAPYAPTMYEEMDEVTAGTTLFMNVVDNRYEVGEHTFTEKTVIADSLFFQTFGFEVVRGDAKDLCLPEALFISRSMARRLFGTADPVGQEVRMEKESKSVTGVFADVPKNGHLQFDAVYSLSSWFGREKNDNWLRGDGFCGYVKLAPGVDPKTVEEKIPALLSRHFDLAAQEKKGWVMEHTLTPVAEIHSANPTVRRMCVILSFLAFALLFVAAMNYVLISVSSLARRAKSIGVHKCNGASGGHIFSLFMYETGLLVFLSLIGAIFLIFIFRPQIEELIRTDLSAVFSLQNLWVALLVVAALLGVAGMIPGRLFASIPVTQVFRTTTENKRRWKQLLLFFQFTGITFMVCLLAIIYFQYQMLLNKDMGYTTENILFTPRLGELGPDQLRTLKMEFERMPEVKKACLTTAVPVEWLSGSSVVDPATKRELFTGRFMKADKDYVETMGMQLAAGRTFTESSAAQAEVMVNETAVRRFQIDNPVGYRFSYLDTLYTICGVIKDYQYMSFLQEIPAIVILPSEALPQYGVANELVLQLNGPLTSARFAALNDRLKTLCHQEDVSFQPYQDTFEWNYKETRLFRNAVFTASLIMLLITLLGLVGYTEDEINRRSKEIAIRKVNGATARTILQLIGKDITLTALPAFLIGMILAYGVGAEWLEQFVAKIPLSPVLFAGCGVTVWLVILLVVCLRGWKVANENPVGSLKSE